MSSVGDLTRLASSFARHLKAENKSLKTVQTYGEAVKQLVAHLAEHGVDSAEAISPAHVEDFIAKLLETRSAATANNRFRSLQQFFKWLLAEEDISTNLDGEHAPAVGAGTAGAGRRPRRHPGVAVDLRHQVVRGSP